MTENKFVYSEDEEYFNSDLDFDTIEDALKNATENLDKDSKVYIGKIKDVDLTIGAWNIIEDLQEDAFEQAGEIAEDFLNNVTQEQENDLTIMINDVIDKWLKKHKLEPNFFSVVDVKQYIIK